MVATLLREPPAKPRRVDLWVGVFFPYPVCFSKVSRTPGLELVFWSLSALASPIRTPLRFVLLSIHKRPSNHCLFLCQLLEAVLILRSCHAFRFAMIRNFIVLAKPNPQVLVLVAVNKQTGASGIILTDK